MINLAGNKDCDLIIKQELDEAGIDYVEFDCFALKQEVPSKVRGIYCGWQFQRAWYYWVAKGFAAILLPMDAAEDLHTAYGKEIRVAGHCGAPSPREWYKEPWHTGVGLYHIDTQTGLNAFARVIRAVDYRKDSR